ncbi:JAB domain-containing protein [Solidesulfovibrio sp.]
MDRTISAQSETSRKPRAPRGSKITTPGALFKKHSYRIDTDIPTIKASEDIFKYLSDVMDSQHLITFLFFLDKNLGLKGREVVSIGQDFPFFLSPGELIRPALIKGEPNIIVAHNNINGNRSSFAIRKEISTFIYEECKLCRLNLLDIIVFGNKGFLSYHREGWLAQDRDGKPRAVKIEPITETAQ